MKKNISKVLLVLFLINAMHVLAQKKDLTLMDAFRGSSYPERLQNTNWIPETSVFTWADGNDYKSIKANKKAKSEILFSLSKLNKAMDAKGEDTLKQLPSIDWIDQDKIVFSANNHYFGYHIYNNILRKLLNYDEEAENADYHKKSYQLAFTIDNNLFIAGNNFQKQITNSEDEDIVYGKEVHRREFGISKGTFWSPDGKKLAFYRKDETMVADYPLVDIKTRIASLKNEKYPMAGEASHHVTVGVYDINSGKTVYLKTGEPKEQYLTNVTWSPDGKTVYIAVLNRDQNHMKLNSYNVADGAFIKTLFEEKHEKYVEPENGPEFLPWDESKFLWISRRDGYNHLYLYNTDGKLINQVTKGEYEVLSIEDFNRDNKEVLITTTEKSPVERHLYKTNLNNGKAERITEKEGTHSVKISPKGNYFLDVYSNMDTGSEYTLKQVKNNKTLHTLVQTNNPLSENFKIGETEINTIKAADGKTDLYSRIIKPYDFDPNKKYPVIIYVYGGPHAQLVRNTWLGGANIFLNYMANQGYIIFTLDNRGSANRGQEFESVLFRNVGEHEVADQMQGVKYLKQQPWVDTSRIGVDGWSYGGFMTINMLLEHPGTFKAGIAGGPVIDWKYYEVMYGERYMDTPQDNPDGYKSSNLLEKVDNLDSRLLVIHGTVDPVVVWQNSLQFLNKAIKNRKLVDYFVYPGQEHNVGGIDRLHLYMKIEQYFKDHL